MTCDDPMCVYGEGRALNNKHSSKVRDFNAVEKSVKFTFPYTKKRKIPSRNMSAFMNIVHF